MFDWKSPAGYVVAFMAQCAAAIFIVFIYMQFLNLLFGSCWFFIFVAEDITRDVSAFNKYTRTKSTEERAKLTKRFFDITEIHSDAKK